MNRPRKSVTTSALAGLTVLGATLAAAQEPDRTSEMRGLGKCADCVFEERDFSDHRLMGVDLSGARLTRTLFRDAALGIAVFDGAILTGVDFAGADLRGASFVGARLVDVSFAGADLKGAVFEGAMLERTDLQPGLLCTTQMPDDAMDNSECD